MKLISFILNSLDKVQDFVNILRAFLAGVDTFTSELKKYKGDDEAAK